jgi:hypothetical protein
VPTAGQPVQPSAGAVAYDAATGPYVLAVSATRTMFSTRSPWSIEAIDFNCTAARHKRPLETDRRQDVTRDTRLRYRAVPAKSIERLRTTAQERI